MYQLGRKKSRGFTLIELSLAMTFVSILLMSVALLTIQLGKLYAHGSLMKDVNQAGSELTSDMRRSISASFIDDVKYKKYTDGSGAIAICFGSISYIANSPAKLEANSAKVKYYNSSTQVHLAKVADTNSALCLNTTAPDYLGQGAKEMLAAGSGNDRTLSVHKISDPTILPDGNGGGLVELSLIVGTSSTAEIINDQCKPPSEAISGGEYCSVNTFTIVGRVGNTFKARE
jgi:prepilin-type N-terminal cleavage/methylation domain-containing protein